MIESCSPKCMLLSIIFLGGITLLVLIIESNWASANNRPGLELLERNISNPAEACPQNEQYIVVQPCHPCTDFEIKSKSVQICAKTHYKEGIKCLKSNHVIYQSCTKVAWLEEKRFWVFEFLMGTSSLLSTCIVILRQRILDHRLMRKVQRQLANSV
nr:PREDICTED: protein JTB-like [Bemisia tabaci]